MQVSVTENTINHMLILYKQMKINLRIKEMRNLASPRLQQVITY